MSISTYKKTVIDKLSKGSGKGILILFTGNTLSQLIPVLATFVIARIFTEAQFGVLVLYSSILLVLSEMATLKYEVAIMLPKEKEKRMSLFVLSMIITMVLSFLLSLVIIFFRPHLILMIDNEDELGQWIYLIPISLLLVGFAQAINYWLNSEKKYKTIAKGRVYKSSVMSAFQLGSGALNYTGIGLIGGLILGQLAQFIYFFKKVVKTILSIKNEITIKNLKKVAAEYRDIPLYNSLMGLMNTLSMHLPIFLLTKYYGIGVVGLYGLSTRLVAAPTGLIKQSVAEVFFASASKKYHESIIEFKKLIRKTLVRLLLFAIGPFTILFFISPFVFSLFFGENWSDAGKYTQLIIPWLFLMFVNSPLTSIVTIIRKQKYYIIYDILLLTSRFLALHFGFVYFNDPVYSIGLYSMVGVVFNLTLISFFYIYTLRKN